MGAGGGGEVRQLVGRGLTQIDRVTRILVMTRISAIGDDSCITSVISPVLVMTRILKR